MIGCECATCRSDDPRDRRWRPSILVELDGGARVLVDTSTDLRAQALRFGVTRVDLILFTHSHADHIMGLDEVRRFNTLQREAIPCYGDERTIADIRRMFSYIFERTRRRVEACRGCARSSSAARSDRSRPGRPRARAITARGGSWAGASGRSRIRPTAAGFPTSRGRCSRGSTRWCRRAARPAASHALHRGAGGRGGRARRRAGDVPHSPLPRSAARGHLRAVPAGV